MTAWLLHLHGVWIGKGGVTQSPETNPAVPTENIELKRYLRSVRGVPSDFREQIGARVKTDGPWLCKTGQNLLKREAWLTHFPDTKWVLCKRNIHAIVRSAMRHPRMRRRGEAQWYEIAANFQTLQYAISIRAEHYHWVNVDKLAQADEDEGRKLVDFCGVGPLNTEIFHDWIQPERWHAR